MKIIMKKEKNPGEDGSASRRIGRWRPLPPRSILTAVSTATTSRGASPMPGCWPAQGIITEERGKGDRRRAQGDPGRHRGGALSLSSRRRRYPHGDRKGPDRPDRRSGRKTPHGPEPERSDRPRHPSLPAGGDRPDARISSTALKAISVDLAKKEMGTILPGYTHLQKAQPVLLVPLPAGLLGDARPGRGAPPGLPEAGECHAARVRPPWRGRVFPIDRRYVGRPARFPGGDRTTAWIRSPTGILSRNSSLPPR